MLFNYYLTSLLTLLNLNKPTIKPTTNHTYNNATPINGSQKNSNETLLLHYGNNVYIFFSDYVDRIKIKCDKDTTQQFLQQYELQNPILLNSKIYGTPLNPSRRLSYLVLEDDGQKLPVELQNMTASKGIQGTNTTKTLVNSSSITKVNDSVYISKMSEIYNTKQNQSTVPNSHNFEDLCVCYYFYKPNCPFSNRASRLINVLPDYVPEILFLAVDVQNYFNLTYKFDITYVPIITLLQGHTVLSKLQSPLTLANLIHMIGNFTNVNTTVLNLTQIQSAADNLDVQKAIIINHSTLTTMFQNDTLSLLAHTFTIAMLIKFVLSHHMDFVKHINSMLRRTNAI